MTKFPDRRIFERFPIRLALRYFDSRSNIEKVVPTRDVSAEGIGFETEEPMSAYTPLEMWLEMPDKGEPLYTRGEVVWSKPIGPKQHRVGVSLEKADLMGISRILRKKTDYPQL